MQLNLIEYIKALFWYAILKENPRFIDPEFCTCWKPFLWKGEQYKHKINAKANHHEEFKRQQKQQMLRKKVVNSVFLLLCLSFSSP